MMDLSKTPRFMLDVHARRLAAALSACIAGTDNGDGFINAKRHTPMQTALRTLDDMRLVTRFCTGWRVTDLGRSVATAWER